MSCQLAASHHGLAHDEKQHERHDRHGDDDFEDERRPARLRNVNLLPAQNAIQKKRVQTCPQADGERKAGVAQRTDKSQVHELRRNERQHAYLDRS